MGIDALHLNGMVELPKECILAEYGNLSQTTPKFKKG
jgi:hypothetical protein